MANGYPKNLNKGLYTFNCDFQGYKKGTVVKITQTQKVFSEVYVVDFEFEGREDTCCAYRLDPVETEKKSHPLTKIFK